MTIREIKIGAGRTFNCPGQAFSNEKPTVEFTASVGDSEDPIKVAKELRAIAEQFVEEWKHDRLLHLAPKGRIREKAQPKASQDQRRFQPLVVRPAQAKPGSAGRPTEKAAVHITPAAIGLPETNLPAEGESRR